MQPSRFNWLIVYDVLSVVVGVIFVFWVLRQWFKRSEDRRLLLVQLLLTTVIGAGLVGIVVFVRGRMEAGDPGGALFGMAGVFGVAFLLAIIWRESIAGIIARPFESLYDGGNRQIDPQALYSIAEAKRKRGHYTEAVAEIRRQLAKYPKDFYGHMMLAEIHAENLNDLPGAELILRRFCEQPGHAMRNVAFALNSLADWQLKYALDRDAARAELERIIQKFPDSEFALAAEQRIAHLASREHLIASHDRPTIPLPRGLANIGLMDNTAQLRPKAADPAAQAAEYVKHLEEFPQDIEARENLAVIYADHYKRLDLAAEQLEQLIASPNQRAVAVTRWLNLLADLQVRHGTGYDAARQTLERITSMFPGTPSADMAHKRIGLLRLQLKSNEKSQAVKLGSYEQNIGLKRGLPD